MILRRAVVGVLGGVLCAAAARTGRADRYEVSVTVRPIAGLARISEDVGGGASTASRRSVAATTHGGGGEIGVAYGYRNWLDLDAELLGAGFSAATYDDANVSIDSGPVTGRLVRTTRLAQLALGATLRSGVSWVTLLHAGLGLGGRMRTAGRVMVAGAHSVEVTPDGLEDGMAVDASANIRVGLEHRLDRRWTLGVSADAIHIAGISAPSINGVSGGLSVSYSWYPMLPW